MHNRFVTIAAECMLDLGITVIYATMAGLLIVAIAASDDGPMSILRCLFYAGILPAGVIALIGCDALVRTATEWRVARRRGDSPNLGRQDLLFGSSEPT